jgi:PTH1 family peptidyl-tRNA hydrolase
MMFIIGLGNPGSRYNLTPHNVGFETADILADRWGISFSENKGIKAMAGSGRIAEKAVTLVKPMTWMNLSGESVSRLLHQKEFDWDEMLVLVDDINLELGRVRIRDGGGHGGHNGLRSLIQQLGCPEFPRLRIGIMPSWPIDDLEKFVLAKLPPVEREQLKDMKNFAADAAESWIRDGLTIAADRYNGLIYFSE